MKSAREILGENLKSLMKSRDIDAIELAEHLGVTAASVSYWINGEKYPRIDKIQKMADYFGVMKSAISEERPTNLIELKPDFVKVPILGPIACGTPILVEENFEGYMYELKEYLPHGNIFALIARGDSMEPTIQDGSKVLVREQQDVENGEIAAVLVNGNTEATLKRVKKQGDNIFLLPDNPKHEMYIVTEANPATIIGKAVRVIRDLL